MTKSASTAQIIEALKAYEETNGPGSVVSIGTSCSGFRDTEYYIHVNDKYGRETVVALPSIDEKTIWED